MPTKKSKADEKLTLSTHMNGRGYRFEAGGRAYVLRPPTSAERDMASLTESKSKRWLRMTDPEISQLADMSPPEEEIEFMRALLKFEEKIIREAAESDQDLEALERKINAMHENVEARTAADMLLSSWGGKKRNRFLASTLICDDEGNPVNIEELSIADQDFIAEKAAEYWDHMDDLDFLSGQSPKSD